MLDWREREHEDVDAAALAHQPMIDALRAFGLYKYWVIPGMRAQVPFLEWLVERWHIQDQCFYIGGIQLEIEASDIYFLTGLPNRGEHLSLFGTRPGGQSLTSLRLEWCNNQDQDKGIEIKIHNPSLTYGDCIYSCQTLRCSRSSYGYRVPDADGGRLFSGHHFQLVRSCTCLLYTSPSPRDRG